MIRKKIKRCKTDAFQGMEWDNPERPECTNLLNIYKEVSGKSREVRKCFRSPRHKHIVPHFQARWMLHALVPGVVESMSANFLSFWSQQEIMEEVKDMKWGDFKPILAEAIIDHLAPIQVSQKISSRT